MRRTLLFLMFFSFILQGCTQSKENIRGNAESPDHYSWDFGRRQEGEILKHTFILKNKSKQILNIKEINTSCGCTISDVKNKVLLPGKSTTIEVQFNTKGYAGLVQQFIYAHTDSVDNPILKFTIKAEVTK